MSTRIILVQTYKNAVEKVDLSVTSDEDLTMTAFLNLFERLALAAGFQLGSIHDVILDRASEIKQNE